MRLLGGRSPKKRNGRSYLRTYERTDTPSYRDAWPHLKHEWYYFWPHVQLYWLCIKMRLRISIRVCNCPSVCPCIRSCYVCKNCQNIWLKVIRGKGTGKGKQLSLLPLPNGSYICWSCIWPCFNTEHNKNWLEGLYGVQTTFSFTLRDSLVMMFCKVKGTIDTCG